MHLSAALMAGAKDEENHERRIELMLTAQVYATYAVWEKLDGGQR